MPPDYSPYKGQRKDVSSAEVFFIDRLPLAELCSSKVKLSRLRRMGGRIMTLENVKRKGINLADGCHMWHREEDTVKHLLSHCSKTQIL